MARVPVAQRRREFIEAAIDVIATRGIDGATTRRIAEQAQANVALLHYCYDSKEDLFSDVYDHVTREFREVVQASGPHMTVTDAALQILRAVMDGYLREPNFAAATMELISWARRQHGDRGIKVYEGAFGAVRDTISQAHCDRPLEPTDIDDITYVIASLADGFGMTWYTLGDRSAAERQIDVNCSVLRSWLADRFGLESSDPPHTQLANT